MDDEVNESKRMLVSVADNGQGVFASGAANDSSKRRGGGLYCVCVDGLSLTAYIFRYIYV